jgi:predicted sugar kinase
LIVDGGKSPGLALGHLTAHIELPDAWRIVLACPKSGKGPSGAQENRLFQTMPAVTHQTAQSLRGLIDERLIPAAREADFDSLSHAIYEYGILAGSCYDRAQCGAYHSPPVRELIESVRDAGVRGTGQSSWGPCVFALCRSTDQARSLTEQLRRRFPVERCWIRTTEIARRGHAVSERGSPPITMDQRSVDPVVSSQSPSAANAPTDGI